MKRTKYLENKAKNRQNSSDKVVRESGSYWHKNWHCVYVFIERKKQWEKMFHIRI